MHTAHVHHIQVRPSARQWVLSNAVSFRTMLTLFSSDAHEAVSIESYSS